MDKKERKQIKVEELRDKAFQLLPHCYTYNDNRERTAQIIYTEESKPEQMCYEEFVQELELYCELEDEDAIKGFGKWLERIEDGIDLVADVSEFPEPDWLVEGLIVRHGLTLLYGDSGTGKTTLCLYVSDALQKGKDFFGLTCKMAKVIFVENDESGELLKSHRDKVGLPRKLDVATCEVGWDATKREFTKDFGKLLYYYIPDVIVIDAYTSLGIPDITRPESALVLDEFRRLSEKYNCAFVIIHHTNVSGGQMGSNLHIAKMDSIVSLTKAGEDRIILTQEKVRGSKFDAKVLSFNQDTLKMKEGMMSVKDLVLELLKQNYAPKEIKKVMPKSKGATIDRYIRESRQHKSQSILS